MYKSISRNIAETHTTLDLDWIFIDQCEKVAFCLSNSFYENTQKMHTVHDLVPQCHQLRKAHQCAWGLFHVICMCMSAGARIKADKALICFVVVLIFRLSLSYFSRYKEIAGRLEAAFSEGLAVAAGSVFHLQVSEVLWSCLAKCWSDKVYVPPLAHRLWKLTLQLYARYAKFLDEVS